MKPFCALFLLAASMPAGPWNLERLFSRPYLWGTRPEKVTFPKRSHTLLFLWNAEGRRFLDLYAYDPGRQKLTRLTDLEKERDPLNFSPAERDERQKQYLAPDEGLADFDAQEDGSRAAFSYRGDLYLAAADGSRPVLRLTRTKAAESAPRFSPDGAALAFIRDGQVHTLDFKTVQLWQVTEVEGEGSSINEYRWSPDGARLAYTVRAGSGRRLLLPNYSGRTVTAPSISRTLPGDVPVESRTYVVPVRGGTPRLMESGPWAGKIYRWEAPQWSPDSTRLLEGVMHSNLKQAQILVEDAATGKATVVDEESDAAWVEPMFLGWAPDSRQVLFTSERDGWSHLYAAPAAGGSPRQITNGPWEIHTERLFSRDPQWIGGHIYYSSTESSTAERQFYRINTDGSGKERLSSREGLNIGQVSEDGQYIALLVSDLHNPWDLFVNGRRVTTSPRPEFAQYAWPETRFVSFPSRGDGKTVRAKLLLPPGYRPEVRSGKHPAVFFIHGSGYATSVLKQWGSYAELRYVFNCYLASRGYLVVDLDYRGSSGYGRDWRTGIYLHLGGHDLDDVLGAVDYLRKLGSIDMQRVGIWGSSYGGFLTDMAMFLSPDTFRAGAAFSAVNDWENYNAWYTEQRLTRPQENLEAYRRSSPIHFSQLLKNPLLLVHGMVDNNVMFQDAVQLSEKLIQEGRKFEQIYYPEENHIFVRDETLIDAFRHAADFFDRHL